MVISDFLVILWVIVMVLEISLVVGIIWLVSFECLVLVVFMKWLVRCMFIDFDLLIKCVRCCVLLILVMMFRLILGWLNFVVLV